MRKLQRLMQLGISDRFDYKTDGNAAVLSRRQQRVSERSTAVTRACITTLCHRARDCPGFYDTLMTLAVQESSSAVLSISGIASIASFKIYH